MSLSRAYEAMWGVRILSKFAVCSFALSLLFIPFAVAAKKTKKANIKPTKVLALVTYFDEEKGEVYNWWAEKNSTVFPRMARIVGGWLEKPVEGISFVNPYKAKKLLPEVLQKTNLNKSQMIQLAKMFEAKVVVSGDLRFKQSPLREEGVRVKANLKAYHSYNGKRLGEVLRISDVSVEQIERISLRMDNVLVDMFNDLSEEIRKGQKKGLENNFRLVVSGQLNYEQLELIKDHLKVSISGIHSIKPESKHNGFAHFDVDYRGKGVKNLVQDLTTFRSPSFMTQVVTAESGQIQLDVKPY